MAGGLTLGNSYFELKEDGVIVHTLGFINGVLVGDQTFKISYTEFNTILQSGLPNNSNRNDDWAMLNRFMTTREGVHLYLLPVGTYEMTILEDGLHVKQKIGSSGWNIISCSYGADFIQADWGSIYSVEWVLTGNIHTIRNPNLVKVVSVKKVLSGVLGTNSCELVDVPFLLEKLNRDVKNCWMTVTKMEDRKGIWVSGADPFLSTVTDEDMRVRRFRNEVLRSSRDRDEIDWDVVHGEGV